MISIGPSDAYHPGDLPDLVVEQPVALNVVDVKGNTSTIKVGNTATPVLDPMKNTIKHH